MSNGKIESIGVKTEDPNVVYKEKYVPVMMQQLNNDDEISLIDLWLILVKRKRVLIYTLGFCVLLGALYAFMKPVTYRYFASIEIGIMGQGNEKGFVEQPDSVLSKLQNSYIPEVLSKFQNDDTSEFEINASLGKGTHIITLEAKAKEDMYPVYQEMLNDVVKRIYLDHQRITGLYKKEIELSKSRTNNQIVKLKDEEALLFSQEKRLDEKAVLLKQRISDAKKSLENAEETRKLAAKNISTEGKALALLMMDNDIRSRDEILANLEEELVINISNEREILANKILENKRKQVEVQEQLDKLDVQYANLLETRALSEPMKSLKPVGPGKKLVLVVAIFMGLFMGVMAAFFVEFLEKVREFNSKQVT